MAIKRNTQSLGMSFFCLTLILIINILAQYIATPGSRWVAYFSTHSTYQLEELNNVWDEFAKRSLYQYQLLQQSINLSRLSPEEFIPVSLFSNINTSGNIEYWGRTSVHLEKSSLVLLGPKGIVGRADHSNENFYKICPIVHKDIQIPVMIAPQGKVMILRGDGELFKGFDRSFHVGVGSTLITIGSDQHYPPFYPVAQVINVVPQPHGIEFEATPLQDITTMSYGILYRSLSSG
jgi:hypothetical protein